MERGICYIVGAGERDKLEFLPRPGDYVIAADAGLRYLEEKGIGADLVIGDFDTLGHQPCHQNVVVLNPVKDDTDMLAALRVALEKGYDTFHLHCGMGGRLEHTLANLQLLPFLAQQGKRGVLVGQDCVVTALAGGTMVLPAELSGFLSVFACGDRAEGVTLSGVKYPLTDAVLTNTYPIGVSNEFLGVEGAVTVEKGTLLLVLPYKAKTLVFDPK